MPIDNGTQDAVLSEADELALINSLNPKQKAKYNKDPLFRQQMRNGFKAKADYGALENTAKNTPEQLPQNEIIQDTLRGPTENNKAGEAVNTGVGSVEGGDKPLGERMEELRDPTPVQSEESEAAYNKSLVDSAVAGDTSGNRDYLIADALATFARNMGKDVGNVAAAYSGGTMNNEREESLLSKRAAQKAQAETEEQIGKEYSNSRLGQELASRGIDIATQNGRLAMANNVKAAMYNKDGTLKYPADSPAYRDLATLYGQLTSGGGSRDSILSGIGRLMNQGISLFW